MRSVGLVAVLVGVTPLLVLGCSGDPSPDSTVARAQPPTRSAGAPPAKPTKAAKPTKPTNGGSALPGLDPARQVQLRANLMGFFQSEVLARAVSWDTVPPQKALEAQLGAGTATRVARLSDSEFAVCLSGGSGWACMRLSVPGPVPGSVAFGSRPESALAALR